MSDPRPIGVFDSGVGGLTVAAALKARLPGERILYLGDTARLPYGTKSPETVARYTRANIDFLAGREVKAIVVACNTASALALDRLETELPVWGVIEPGAGRAAEVSRGRIGVIATESTIASDAYARAIHRLAPGNEVVSVACPLFVPLVEEGWFDDPVTETVARRYLASLLERRIDTLVLGCTHYPLLVPLLSRIVGPDVTLVDSAAAVSELVAASLAEAGLVSDAPPGNGDHYCVTDLSGRFTRIAGQIVGERVTLELVDVGTNRERSTGALAHSGGRS
ncbi:MAG: glutamate racemase [Thermoanaerobaculia bacterium]